MKKILLVLGLGAAVVGCGKDGGTSDTTRDRTRPGAIQSEPAGAGPTEKVKPGVEFPGEYPAGANLQRNQDRSSNADSVTHTQQQPFGTARANSGAYERTNNLER